MCMININVVAWPIRKAPQLQVLTFQNEVDQCVPVDPMYFTKNGQWAEDPP